MRFSVIVLGEQEKLAEVDSEFQHGTVDVLAAHPKSTKLFIIGCTTTRPKPEDHNNLLNAKAVIERAFGPNMVVQPLIVTAASGYAAEGPPSIQMTVQAAELRVLDREALERIITTLHTGDIDSALRLVDNGFWS